MIELVSYVLPVDIDQELMPFSLEDPFEQSIKSMSFHNFLFRLFLCLHHLLVQLHLLLAGQVHIVAVAHAWRESTLHARRESSLHAWAWLHHGLGLGLLVLLDLSHKLGRYWLNAQLLLPCELWWLRNWRLGSSAKTIAHE